MQLASHQFTLHRGWNNPLDPALDSENSLLVIFGGSDLDKLASGFADLRRNFPNSVWIGCSTSGEIYDHSLDDGTLAVAVMKFTNATLRKTTSKIVDTKSSFQIGSDLITSLSAPDLKGVLVLSDGLLINGSELARGLSQNLPEGVKVTGGLAGSGVGFNNTWVIVDNTPQPHHVVAVGLYGDHVGITCGSHGGWDVLGPAREVTRSEGNVLYSLDGQPALSLYKKYLGERAADLPTSGLLFPLAILNDQKKDGLTVRCLISINEDEDSITFAGDIPQGGHVQLMRANYDRLIDGALAAVSQLAFDDYVNGPLLTLAISCAGRRAVLTQRIEEEIDIVFDGLPPGSALVGFYSSGELTTLASGCCALLNQTMTLASFWEK